MNIIEFTDSSDDGRRLVFARDLIAGFELRRYGSNRQQCDWEIVALLTGGGQVVVETFGDGSMFFGDAEQQARTRMRKAEAQQKAAEKFHEYKMLLAGTPT